MARTAAATRCSAAPPRPPGAQVAALQVHGGLECAPGHRAHAAPGARRAHALTEREQEVPPPPLEEGPGMRPAHVPAGEQDAALQLLQPAPLGRTHHRAQADEIALARAVDDERPSAHPQRLDDGARREVEHPEDLLGLAVKPALGRGQGQVGRDPARPGWSRGRAGSTRRGAAGPGDARPRAPRPRTPGGSSAVPRTPPAAPRQRPLRWLCLAVRQASHHRPTPRSRSDCSRLPRGGEVVCRRDSPLQPHCRYFLGLRQSINPPVLLQWARP